MWVVRMKRSITITTILLSRDQNHYKEIPLMKNSTNLFLITDDCNYMDG